MSIASNHDAEVDSLLLSHSCWSQQSPTDSDHYLLTDGDKMLLTSGQQDGLLLASQPLEELKPLPPFAGYTGHLSINGIPGHHYHSIAQRPQEENNNYTQQSQQPQSQQQQQQQPQQSYAEHDQMVSSSTCAPDSCLGNDVKLFDEPRGLTTEYDMSSIEDIAAIIGSAIADTTVPSQLEGEADATGSRDSWMDLDAWIDGACSHQDSGGASKSGQEQDEFVLPNSPLQSLLTHGYMPLLQNRLTHGPPVKAETPSSTNYADIISASSPPGGVVSTTDNLLLNGRYLPHHYALGHGPCSPDRLISYPHTTSTTSSNSKSSKRSRAQKKAQQQQQHQQQQMLNNNIGFQTNTAADLGGLLGKEKPVHRCNICNRGFLNKSNIKVHLRTHTGEKPFRCEVCSKAFRQKAHLIKHQQIHKRIGRD